MRHTQFRGQSGQAYRFVRMAPNAPWARQAGVALFAAQGTFGWRVVKLATLRGRLHDVQPIWAYADAERYGARAIFVLAEPDAGARQAIIADLEAGLSPVCTASQDDLAIAA
ncbi:MAG: hypothetical protein AAGF20_02910 [Pseudomonadota bacterium]